MVRHNWGRAEEYIKLRSKAEHIGLHPNTATATFPNEEEEVREDVVVEEWTAPSSVCKPLFFWNLNGVITQCDASPTESLAKRALRWMLGAYWIPFQLFVVFYALDNYPVFVGLEGRLAWLDGLGRGVGRRAEHCVEHVVTFAVLFVASLAGRMFRVEAVSEERTPVGLWEVWVREKDDGRKKDL